MLKVTFTQNRVEIEAQTDSDQAELLNLTQSLVQSVMSTNARPVSSQANGTHLQVKAAGNSTDQAALPLPQKETPPSSSHSRYTSSLGVSQVYVAAFALHDLNKHATAREVGEGMLAMPGYVTKAKDHMDVVRQILRSNRDIFFRDEEGLWSLTEKGLQDVLARKSSSQREDVGFNMQQATQT